MLNDWQIKRSPFMKDDLKQTSITNYELRITNYTLQYYSGVTAIAVAVDTRQNQACLLYASHGKDEVDVLVDAAGGRYDASRSRVCEVEHDRVACHAVQEFGEVAGVK